jgi:hypothetical protein
MKSYKQFIKESKTDIDLICQKFDIENYTINSDGSIDIEENVYLDSGVLDVYKSLSEFPIKFRTVSGNFKVYQNNLTSLEGSPTKVSGNFNCNNNKLTSLKGCPKEVGGDFMCSRNNLTSLVGSSDIIGGDFICRDNKLTSLEGSPKKVGGDFICYNNNLTSLEGCPTKVSNFDCDTNELTSLIGCPENIGGTFRCKYNIITDFKGISEFFEGTFYCNGNQIYEIYSLFNKDVRCIKFINEFDVIIDGQKVILDRLEEVFHQLGMDIPENIEFKNYQII